MIRLHYGRVLGVIIPPSDRSFFTTGNSEKTGFIIATSIMLGNLARQLTKAIASYCFGRITHSTKG